MHWTEAAVKGQTQVLGRDVAHQYKARVFGAEANSEFVLDLQNLRGGFDVGAGAYVVKHQETIDILLSQSRALRAQGEIGLGSVAWKRALMVRAGLPPIEKAGRTDTIPTPVPITVGGKIGLIDPNEFGNF